MPQPVYLVRHGQSEWNVLRLTQGQTPHPRLTRRGRRQAERAAGLIAADLAPAGRPVGRIVTSDLVRAIETAEILAARLGVPVTLDARLREQHLGTLEGRGYDETWAVADAHDWSDPALPVGGGESMLDVRDRITTAIQELDSEKVNVVVSHGDAIRIALAQVQGVPPHQAAWTDVPNGAVARVCGGIAWLS